MEFLLLFPVLVHSASVKKEFGTVFLCPNETFRADLDEYFEGNFLNYTAYENGTTDGYIIGGYLKAQTFTYPLPEAEGIIAINGVVNIVTVLCARGLKIYVFSSSLVNGQTSFVRQVELTSNLTEANIISMVVKHWDVFIIVTGTETIMGAEFSVNEIFYLSLADYSVMRLEVWDLKYAQNLMIAAESSAFIGFWGRVGGGDLVLLYRFIDNYLELEAQIDSFYITNSTQRHSLSIIDLLIFNYHIIVLDDAFGLVVFQLIANQIANQFQVPLPQGRPLKLSRTNWQMFSITDFAIILDTGVLILDLQTYNLKSFISTVISQTSDCLILTPYLFLFSSTELAIYNIGKTAFESLYLVPFGSDGRAMSIIKESQSYTIVKDGESEIEFWDLQFNENVLAVKSLENSTVAVYAEDEESCARSILNIEIIEELFGIYTVYDYRESDPSVMDRVVYLDGTEYSTDVEVFQVFSGWNISAQVESFENDILVYNITQTFPIELVERLRFVRNYTSAYLGSDFYLLNADGVYQNETLIVPDPNPIKLIRQLDNYVILYSNYFLFYNYSFMLFHNESYSSNCSQVFKSFTLYVFCVDSSSLLILLGTKLVSRFQLSTITNGESVLDLTYVFTNVQMAGLLYLQTATRVYLYLHSSSAVEFIMSIESEARFIVHGKSSLYLIGKSVIVYDLFLKNSAKSIPLPEVPNSVFNHNDVLFLQISENFYVFNGLAPVIQSLAYLEAIGNCQVSNSKSNLVFLLCSDHGLIYKDTCFITCIPQFTITYLVTNPSAITQGNFFLEIEIQLQSSNTLDVVLVTHKILTYPLYLYFDESTLPTSRLIVDYDSPYSISLRNKFEGFNINYTLYINETKVTTYNPWVVLSPRVIKNNYLEADEFAFVDHDYLRYTDVVLVLCKDSIVFYEVMSKFNLTEVYRPKEVGMIRQEKYFNFQGTCSSINYISTKGNSALFLLVCKEVIGEFRYFEGEIEQVIVSVNSFVFIEVDVKGYWIRNVTRFGVDHEIGWINTISSCETCFSIICIDTISTTLTTNNNLYTYSCSWKTKIHIKKFESLNFLSLNLSSMHLTCADGIYKTNPNCASPSFLFLYATDSFFGLRVLNISHHSVSLITSIEYQYDTVISVGVCGNSLFVLTQWTDVDQYFIGSDYVPKFFLNFQPSYSTNFEGVSSVITCSSYYRANYLAVYLYSTADRMYQLRLIDLRNSIYASYVKFIPLNGDKNVFYRAKSIFIKENMLTALGGHNGELYTFFISEINLMLPEMTEDQFDEMVNKWGGNSFQLMIGYSNEYNAKNSSSYLITRNGPGGESGSGQDGENVFLFLVLGGIILVVLVGISLLMYKRFIGNRRRHQQIEMNSLVSMVKINTNMRMSMMSSSELSY